MRKLSDSNSIKQFISIHIELSPSFNNDILFSDYTILRTRNDCSYFEDLWHTLATDMYLSRLFRMDQHLVVVGRLHQSRPIAYAWKDWI